MKLGKSPEGKWVHVEGKTIVATFETKEDAIASLPAKTKSDGCRHGNRPKPADWIIRPRQVATEILKTDKGYRAYPEYLWEWGFVCRNCHEWITRGSGLDEELYAN